MSSESFSKKRVRTNLEAACETMQEAVDNARRYAKSGDSFAAQQVLHQLSWGFANASGKIESAIAAVEDDFRAALYEASAGSPDN